MSIINKMLQDLDKRNGRPGGEAMAGDAIRSIKPQSSWHLGRNTLLVVVGLTAASLAGAWWLQQRNRGVESSVVVPAPPVPVLANNSPPAVSQISPASPVPKVAVVTATPPKVTALASPPPTASASSPSTSDKLDTSAPLPKTVAMSTKAAGGKTYSPKQVSANLLGEAVMLDQQGRQEEAKVPLQRALAANPLDVQARQMLIQLQLDTGQVEEAGALLAEGQRLLPEQSNFTLALARLKVERGDVSGAIQLLEAGQASARNEPQYHAFLAALLLRVQRYDEAVQHYLVALRSDPANTSWLVGVGVALEGVGKLADATEAYRRADGAANLTPEMANFLSERLARLGR
jgi:MSHA biogenesis protein MshN